MLACIVSLCVACARPSEGPLIAGRELIPETLTSPVWRVGGTAEQGGVILEATPWDAALRADGSAAVIDRVAGRLLLLDTDGSLLRTIGSHGSGPGEFLDPWKVGLSGDSLVWVADARSGRLSWFDSEGTLVKTLTRTWTPVPGSRWSVRGNWALADGSVLGLAAMSGRARTPDTLSIPLSVWDGNGRLTTIDWVHTTVPTHIEIPTSHGLPIGSRQPLDGAPIIDIESGGEWFYVLDRSPAQGESGVMTFVTYRPSGDVLGRVEIPYRAHRTDDDVISWLEQRATTYETQTPASAGKVRAEDVMAATWVPPWLPPVRSSFVDRTGIWLERERTAPGVWERYDLAGRLVAWVRLPDGFRGLAATPTRLLGHERDSFGVSSIVVYRLTDTSGGQEGIVAR